MSREPSTSCLEVNGVFFLHSLRGPSFFSLDFFFCSFLGGQFDVVEVLSLKPPLQKCARIHVPTWRVVMGDGSEATRRWRC